MEHLVTVVQTPVAKHPWCFLLGREPAADTLG